MQLTFLDKTRIQLKTLPVKISGQYAIQKTNNQPLLTIEAEQVDQNTFWLVKSTKYAQICDAHNKPCRSVRVLAGNIYKVDLIGQNHSGLLMVETLDNLNHHYTKYEISEFGPIRIGKSSDNDIVFENAFVSRYHANLIFQKNQIIIEDLNSANGTYVNGVKTLKSVVLPGHVIYIVGLKIIIGYDFIAINQPNGVLNIQSKLVDYKMPEIRMPEERPEIDSLFFSRAPRFRKTISPCEFKVDAPPQIQNPEGVPVLLMLGPSLTMGMSSLLMGYFTLSNTLSSGRNIGSALPTLSMSFFMMLGMVLWPTLTKRFEKIKRDEKEALRQEKYKQYLTNVLKDIKQTAEVQELILHENFLPVRACIEKIERKSTDLWERQYQHGDFLEVRLGLGTIPMLAKFNFPEWRFTIEDDNLQNILQDVAKRPKLLENVPVTLSLMEQYVSGIIGSRNTVVSFIKGLIFQLVSLHSYDELKLVVICEESELELWQFAKWLPHIFSENNAIRFYATSANDVKTLSSYLEQIFMRRKQMSKEELLDEKEHFLIVSASKALSSKAQITKLLLERAKKSEDYIGFSIISLYDEVKNLPKECTSVIELTENEGKIYSNFNVTGGYTRFQLDVYNDFDAMVLAKKLFNTKLDVMQTQFELPKILSFMDMNKAGKIQHLNILSKWQENNPVLSLKAPIGVDAYGDLFYLDIHEKFHGPHGLVAGMTGSGKSEFIMTYILSMAINYHPHEVAFILIDFKGGGMADSFNDLPHVAGKITNLDGSLMNRSLISIESELKRRQRIFSETSQLTGISNIDIYRYQQLYREGKVSEPIQHLIIISDEFAELKSQQPEFMDKLISAARIGRSLGVHLILATQKPSGVVNEQIWANSRFRVCLKVQEKADSMEMIKRPEAANIAEAGRYYIQVGYNELFELGQSAWAGAPYQPCDKFEAAQEAHIIIIDDLGRELRRSEVSKKLQTLKQPAKQIDEITKYIQQLMKDEPVAARKLWLEPIEPYLVVNDVVENCLFEKENGILNPVIGMLDDPEAQKQTIFTLPLSQQGNAIVYGVTDSGKTTFITTMIYRLICDLSPEQINLYIMDFGAQTLKAFENAPQVGGVIFSDEEDKITNLFNQLKGIVTLRRKLLSQYGGDFYKYKKITGDQLPAIVVVIHNYGSFSELYPDYFEVLRDLTGNALKYGVYFILTASSSSSIRYRLVQNFNQLFALRFNDDSEYSAVVGHTNGLRPAYYKGRGLVRLDKIYEFQTAYVHDDPDTIFEHIQNFCRLQQKLYPNIQANRIKMMPLHVDGSFLKNLSIPLEPCCYPIGIGKRNLEPVVWDFSLQCITLVSSSHAPLKNFISGLLDISNIHTKPEWLFLDPNQEILNSSVESLDSKTGILSLFELMVFRNNTYKTSIENHDPLPEFEPKIYVINGYQNLVKVLNADLLEKLNLLLEKNEPMYRIYFVIATDVHSLSKYRNELWYKKHCHQGIQIWLGDGIMQQTSLVQLAKYDADMYHELGESFGYIISKNRAQLIKYVVSEKGVE